MKRITFLLFSLLFAAGWTQVNAQDGDVFRPDPVILTDEQEEYPLGLHLEILEDPGGKLTIEDVTSAEFESQFVPSQVKVPNYGFTNSVYWLRFRLDNEARQTNKWWLQLDFANMHFVDLYTLLPDGEGWAVKQTGFLKPASTRDILHPKIIFDLNIPNQSQQSYYLRFQSGASMTLPLTLWTPDAFSGEALREQWVNGIFYGVLIGLLAYHLFLFFSLRETIYLYFIFLLVATILLLATYDGYAGVYFLPNHSYLMEYLLPVSFSLLFFMIVLFTGTLLDLKKGLPKFHGVKNAVLVVWVVLILLTPFVAYYHLAQLVVPMAMFTLVLVLVLGIMSFRINPHPARPFIIGWPGLLTTLLVLLLVRLGDIPSIAFFENAFRLGFVWMVVSWSIALADRINSLKAETESANRELRKSEFRLSQILEGLPLGVVVYGNDQKPNFTNRRTYEILGNPAQGIAPDLAAGRTLAQAIKYFSLQVAGSNQEYPLEDMPIYQALQGKPATADDIEADLVDRRVPLEIWASPIRDDTGNVESAVIAFQDITRRKQTDAELAEYRKRLELLVEERTTELSAINERLNDEIASREKLELSLYQHIEWLTTLSRVRQSISGTADLPQAYGQLLVVVHQLLDACDIFLLRWDGRGQQVEVVWHQLHGEPNHDLEGLESAFTGDSPLRKELEQGKRIEFSADRAISLPAPLGEWFQEGGRKSLMLMPITLWQATAGVFGVAMLRPLQDLTPAQAELVEAMAADLAGLLESARLFDQVRTLVAAEERNRLARDLHDSVTQVLFSASLVAEVLPQIWRRDPEMALQSLEELRQLTRSAMAEMRTMLLELRPDAVVKSPLADLLAQLTEATTSRIKLPFQLFFERCPPLPEEVHTSFYRIAQEALNNVVKHAQATRVTVSLSATPLTTETAGESSHEIRLVVADDGVGFSPGKDGSGHLGMSTMRERAAAIKATLFVNSQPGRGMRVTLIWPGKPEE